MTTRKCERDPFVESSLGHGRAVVSFEPAAELGLGVLVRKRGIVFTLSNFIRGGMDKTLTPPIPTALTFTEPVKMGLWLLFSLFRQL